jgi:hypoxanthine phosphoribosyltransferase
MMIDVNEHDVLLVDDIFDTGKTLARLTELVQGMGAKTVGSAVLLHKQREHDVSLRPDFVGFEIPDEFVVGYGLDYLDLFRNLPFLGILDPEDIEAARDRTAS